MDIPVDKSVALGCVTAAEDKELDYEAQLEDIRSVHLASCDSKLWNALKHLDFFLAGYLEKIKSPIINSRHLTYYGGVKTSGTSEEANEWWDNMIGNLFSYLYKDAYKYGDPDKDRISYETATGYASSIKVFYTNKFRTCGPELNVFGPTKWRELRNKLLAQFKEENKSTGKTLVNGHEASEDTDRNAIAIGCYWLGTPEAAEFLHLNNTMMQCSGRGTEVSLLTKDGIKASDVNELCYSYQILKVDLARQKDGPRQSISTYPHRDSVHQDVYFSLMYLIVMNPTYGMSKYLFPKFASKALNTNSKGKIDSKVSALWMDCFNDLLKKFKALAESINAKLSSHHGKKGSNQKMGESSVAGLAQIFRTGWAVRGTLTIFDYVIGSERLSQQAGKVVSNWHSKAGDTILGGQPPKLQDITTNSEQLDDFVNILFAYDKDRDWPSSIRNLLVSSLLRHYEEFISIIKSHPEAAYIPSHHPFVHRVNDALRSAKVSQETFEAWKLEIRHGFASRNAPALPIEALRNQAPKVVDNFYVDTRTFTDHYNQLVVCFQSLHGTAVVQGEQIGTMSKRIDALETELKESRSERKRSIELLESIADRIAVDYQKGPLQKNQKTDSGMVLPFSVSYEHLKRSPRLIDVFVYFFDAEAKLGYYSEQQSTKNKTDEKHRKKTIAKFARIKKIVKLMLLNIGSYPGKKPTDPKQLATWQENLLKLGKQAEQNIYVHFTEKLSHDKFNVSNVLTNTDVCQKMQQDLKLPLNTPAEELQFFNKR
jgi:hypothetical protein